MAILLIVYMVAGYWAAGKTYYADKIVFGTFGSFFIQRVLIGTIFGWVLIPWAIIKGLSGR